MLLDYILLLLRPEEPIAMGKVENQKKKKRWKKRRPKGKEAGGSIVCSGPQRK